MKITIQGQDYSAWLDAIHPLTIERKLNEPTVCQFWLSLASQGGVATPVRGQSIVVTGDNGTPYFTGYVACTPLPEYAGLAMDGPRYRIAVRAISDEFLMDQLPATPMKAASGMTAGQLMTSLVTHTRATLATNGISCDAAVSNFAPLPGATWSRNAGIVASQARAAYRAMAGALQLSAIPVNVHPLSESDGTLNVSALSLTSGTRRALANDITICGEHEPAAFVTEYFSGDGATVQFCLGALPWFPSASSGTIIDELFNQGTIDQTVWSRSSAPAYLSVGDAGLTMNGGNGIDGETVLAWLDTVEMGGTLFMEASGVTLSAGSNGILAGLYSAPGTIAGCIAGFQVKAQAGTGAVSVQPIVQGAASGSTYNINPANQYALRIRTYCPEIQRMLATYRSFGDAGTITYGGQTNDAPGNLLFEIQEYVNGVAGMPVILYEGSITSLPSNCFVVAASLTAMVGTMRAFQLLNLGSGWVVSTPAGGNPYTRKLGTPAEAGECYLERTGRLVFANGFAPLPGEQVAVSYRAHGRAVGRAANAASQQQLSASGLPPVAQFMGSVTSPAARSSADCRNAAAAMVGAAASAIALWSGTYRCTSAAVNADIWPGDALWLNAPSLNLDSQLVVRAVRLSYASSYPDLVSYDISFANDWADDLAIRTSDSVPADAWLPAPINPTMLSNLGQLTVTALSSSTVTIHTGMAPPPGGGFEIRRRDFAFMPGEDSDLVMRGTQQTMTFARESAGERFYIRAYDGSTPPNYSEFSAALFINLPVSSGQ